MKVVLFGATGMIGQGVVGECLLDPGVDRVLAIGRAATGLTHPKLRELAHGDFLDFSAITEDLTGYNACFFCLGVSSAGMTEADYRRVTFDMPMAAARVLASGNPQMTLIYVSGAGDDGTGRGRLMWARAKGKAENALIAMPFKAVYVFRPAFVQPMHGVTSRTALCRYVYAVMAPPHDQLRHHPGESDDSASQVSALTPVELSNVISAFEWEIGGIKPVSTRLDVIGRAVLLHTDIAMFAIADPLQDQVNVSALASLHFGVALELIDVLNRENPKGQTDPVVLGWWRTVAAVLGERRETVSAPAFMQRALSLFPADPEILVMAGVLHELLVSPAIQDGVDPGASIRELWASIGENQRAAERCFRDALNSAPQSTEARVRLGRVLVERQRPEAAAGELARTVGGDTEPRLRFFSYLFLGEAREA
ncbi:MAG TPA: hypothetical protein VF332_08305, partial [Vicinamibacterales bacterium]